MSKQLKQTLCCGLIIFFSLSHPAGAEPTLTMAYMFDAEPQMWVENGVARGIEPEIAQYICDQLGIKVVHEFYPWARAQEMVKSGKADAMFTTPTAIRFQYAAFGRENMLPCYWNLFIRKGNRQLAEDIKKFTRLEDLKPYNLVDFIGNGWTAAFMKKEDGYNIHFVSRLEQLPEMVALGRADLTINGSDFMRWWAAKKGVADQIEEHNIEWPWTRFHYVFMVSRKSPWLKKGLVRAFDNEIRKMKESGIWQEILKKYKNPYGLGEPFTTMLDAEYARQGGFYDQYDRYPIYVPTSEGH
ncbi:substrate-binding periplasmic protein [Thermodesulfobacteriota bacterium]